MIVFPTIEHPVRTVYFIICAFGILTYMYSLNETLCISITINTKDYMNLNDKSETNYKHCHGYVRWSSDQQEDGDSSRRQTELIEHSSKRLNLPLIKIYTDNGVSAAKGKNLTSEWAKLKSNIQAGDVILVENTDRITRMGVHTLFNELKSVFDKKAVVYTTSNGVLINEDNYDKDLNVMVSGAVAKNESDKKVERIKEAKDNIKQTMLMGKFIKAWPLPSWIANGDGCYVLKDVYANVVKRMFELYESGHSIREIRNILNSDKIQPPRNIKGWNGGTIAKTLKNKSVMGYLSRINGEYVKEDIKIFPAVISEDLFYSVQKKLHERTAFCGKVGCKRNLFRGLLWCNRCGSRLIGYHQQWGRKTKTLHSTFVCNGKNNGICDYYSLNGDKFTQSFRFIFNRSDIIASYYKSGCVTTPTKLNTFKSELSDIKKKETRLAKLITNDENPSENLLRNLKELEVEDRRLSKLIGIEEAIIKSETPTLNILKDYNLKQMDKDWEQEESRLKLREIIRSVCEKIVCDCVNKTYTVYFKNCEPIEVKLNKNDFEIGKTKISYV